MSTEHIGQRALVTFNNDMSQRERRKKNLKRVVRTGEKIKKYKVFFSGWLDWRKARALPLQIGAFASRHSRHFLSLRCLVLSGCMCPFSLSLSLPDKGNTDDSREIERERVSGPLQPTASSCLLLKYGAGRRLVIPAGKRVRAALQLLVVDASARSPQLMRLLAASKQAGNQAPANLMPRDAIRISIKLPRGYNVLFIPACMHVYIYAGAFSEALSMRACILCAALPLPGDLIFDLVL